MSNVKSQQEKEAGVMAAMAEEDKIDPTDRDNFNVKPGYPLPEGFENPPLSTEENEEYGHLCLDRAGNYQPLWCQLRIDKIHDKQIDPQPFPLGTNYQVPLDTWVDAPPEVIESLRSAVEVHHEHNIKPGDIELGRQATHKETKRRRFVWHSIKSA